MRIANEAITLSSTDMSGSITGTAIYLGHICNYSIQLVFTGSPSGTFKLQCSNDAGNPNGAVPPSLSSGVTNWTDIAGSSQVISAAGDITYQVENAGYAWVRVVYTFTSGTGTITSARVNVKGV